MFGPLRRLECSFAFVRQEEAGTLRVQSVWGTSEVGL